MTPTDNNNMQHDLLNWPFLALLSSVGTASYNLFMSAVDSAHGWLRGISVWGVHEWAALAGVLGMIITIVANRHYNRRREYREAEKHEWERERHALEIKMLTAREQQHGRD